MTASPSTGRKSAKWLWVLIVALAALAAGLAASVFVHARNQEFERERAEKLEAEKNELLEQSSQLRERLSSIQHAMEELAAGGNKDAEQALRRQRELEKARSREAVTAGQFQQALGEARAYSDALSKKVVSLEQELAALQQENEQARKNGSDLESQRESSRRLIAALQEQVKSKEKTLASLEAAYQRYKDSNQESSRQLDVVTKTIADLEDVNRRRLRVLEQASRRMRELSDNLRTMAVRIDTDSRGQSGMGAEITRIQSAATNLDDQIAQINNLNAQAASLERRLEQARGSN
ncbi:MAG: hypothetical protein IT169_14100 [Bryobacterales bacterium]|nr:hypothetical protein [Bryobacterales bacterium]